MNKELCDCGKVAVWLYMPGFSNRENPFFCDDCVPRGCSCNHHSVKDRKLEDDQIKWIVKDERWCHVDDKGREYPCCEYDYDEDGYDKEE